MINYKNELDKLKQLKEQMILWLTIGVVCLTSATYLLYHILSGAINEVLYDGHPALYLERNAPNIILCLTIGLVGFFFMNLKKKTEITLEKKKKLLADQSIESSDPIDKRR